MKLFTFIHSDNTTVESSAFNENEIHNDNDNENENADAFSENDETSEWNDQDQEQNSKQSTLLFRGGFFRFLRKEGTIVRAECLSCKQGNEYSGQRWSNSNFLKHMSVRSTSSNSIQKFRISIGFYFIDLFSGGIQKIMNDIWQ